MAVRVQSDVRTFRSVHHPGSSAASLVFARNLVVPLAACFIPVMIVALVKVLQASSPMSYVLWGFPAAALVAFVWTAFRVRATPAEIIVASGFAVVRSVSDVVRKLPVADLEPVLDFRRSRLQFELAIGETSFEMSDDDWPELSELHEALQEAKGTMRSMIREAHRDTARASGGEE